MNGFRIRTYLWREWKKKNPEWGKNMQQKQSFYNRIVIVRHPRWHVPTMLTMYTWGVFPRSELRGNREKDGRPRIHWQAEMVSLVGQSAPAAEAIRIREESQPENPRKKMQRSFKNDPLQHYYISLLAILSVVHLHV